MNAPINPLSIVDRYIETCERALPVEEEMAATAPPEREESAQERLDRMQAAIDEAKRARAALAELIEAAKYTQEKLQRLHGFREITLDAALARCGLLS